MLTIHHAVKFKCWKVNSCCPGFTSTNLNAFRGTGTVEDAMINIIRWATLGRDEETGTFSEKGNFLNRALHVRKGEGDFSSVLYLTS